MSVVPDNMKYKVLKIKLEQIIKKQKYIGKLSDAMCRTNKLIIHVYQFLKLWLLSKYHNNIQLPEITKDVISMAFKALSIKSTGGKNPKSDNEKLYIEFKHLYETEYKILGYPEKISALNLSQILSYSATSMITAIENNIKANFFNYVKRFVNAAFASNHAQILVKYNGKEKVKMRKALKKELYLLKNDLFDNTRLSDKKYHTWIDIHRPNILPSDIDKVSPIDVKNNPQSFLKYMIYMNIELENNKQKMFQFFPLRTNIIPKYIPIDTKSIIEILVDEKKGDYLSHVSANQKELWTKYFKLDNSIFKMKNYKFNYYITTDCFSVSIHFIHRNFLQQDQQKKENKANNKKKTKEKTKGMTEIEKADYRRKKSDEEKQAKKDITKKYKEAYNKLSKEEKKAIIIKNKEKKSAEFPYIDELNELQLAEMQINTVYCDPGKRDIFTMKNNKGIKYSYSNKQRMFETKRLKYHNLLANHKNKRHMSEIENSLSKYNSKSCLLNDFKQYILNKNKINSKLFLEYYDPIFRQYKWYSYLNTQKSNSKLLDTIEKKFTETKGKKVTIIIGDWCIGKQMRNFISTPMISLKRLLKTRFNVYNIDEYNTSCIHYKTEEKCKNLYYTDKNKQTIKLHSVLTCKMENQRKACINRDVNSVNNMRKLVEYWLLYKSRPDKYKPNKNQQPISVLSTGAPNADIPVKVQLSIKSNLLSGSHFNKITQKITKPDNINKIKVSNLERLATDNLKKAFR